MKTGLNPNIPPELARELLKAHATGGMEPVRMLMAEFRDSIYGQMLVAPDDMLAGYRGMLLCLNNLMSTTAPGHLRTLMEKKTK